MPQPDPLQPPFLFPWWWPKESKLVEGIKYLCWNNLHSNSASSHVLLAYIWIYLRHISFRTALFRRPVYRHFHLYVRAVARYKIKFAPCSDSGIMDSFPFPFSPAPLANRATSRKKGEKNSKHNQLSRSRILILFIRSAKICRNKLPKWRRCRSLNIDVC